MAKPRLGLYLVLGSVPQLAGYVGLPLLAARRDRRIGWRGGRPGGANLVGLALVGLGAAGLEWSVLSHYRAAPADVTAVAVPDYLVAVGAYGRSRNPLYVSGLTMWAGWGWFLGSRRAIAAAIALASFFATAGVPFEERMLRAKFGERYDRYVTEVPRWL